MNKQSQNNSKPRIKTSTKATVREAQPCQVVVY